MILIHAPSGTLLVAMRTESASARLQRRRLEAGREPGAGARERSGGAFEVRHMAASAAEIIWVLRMAIHPARRPARIAPRP